METKEKKAPAKAEVKKDTWEYKDRNYYLAGKKEPLTFKLPSRHTSRHPMFWFDESAGYNRELRYATNQKSVFVDEQNGPVTLAHIIFNDGTLFVPKEKVQLQKLLSMYHPAKGKLYHEYDKVEEAVDQLDYLQVELEAMNIASKLELDHAEAILRVEQGSSVISMTSKEIKRDLLVFARRKPQTFLALVEDENVVLRNFAIKAKKKGIL
jgi:hypothetical protein